MLELFKNRRSCRKFDSKMVEKEKIQDIINAGLLAPSGMGRQTPVIIAITDKTTRDKYVEIKKKCSQRKLDDDFDPMYNAPVILLVIANKNGISVNDGCACIENMLLESTNQGLGSCWIHGAKEIVESIEGRELLSFTGLDFDEYIGVGHVIVGYSLMDSYPEKVIKEGRVFYK